MKLGKKIVLTVSRCLDSLALRLDGIAVPQAASHGIESVLLPHSVRTDFLWGPLSHLR